jgi:dienelactone hydrolase
MHIYKPLSAFVQSGFLQEQLQNKSIMKQTLFCVVTISLMCSLAYAAPEDRGSYTWSKYTVKIPARDSGSITALLYIPTAQKAYPLLAIRHGLSKKKIKYLSLTKYGEHFASRGFVVLLPNARTESFTDFEIEADDINDCMNWAINRSNQPGNSLSGKIDENKQAVGGVSGGGLVATIATAKNNNDPNALIKYRALMCFEPGDINGLGQYYAPMISTPTVTIFGENTLCSTFNSGAVIFHKVTGPAYGLKVIGADHCDTTSRYSLGCAIVCMCLGWDEYHNKSYRRYGTAFLEAYLNCDSDAFPYMNGSMAQSDPLVKLYPDNHDLEMPPVGCQ